MTTIKVEDGDYFALITYSSREKSHSYKAVVIFRQHGHNHVVDTCTGSSNFLAMPEMVTCKNILRDGIEVHRVAKKYGLE